MRVDSVISKIGSNSSQVTKPENTDFTKLLKTALHNVNDQLKEADETAILLMQDEIDVHNATIIAEKANLALQLTMAIRNKIIEAYQEIMRMQV